MTTYDMAETFNAKMLKLCRESRGLVQKELALRTGIPQARVSRIEHENATPSAEEIDVIANVLEYPVDVFFVSDPLYGPGLGEYFHRKKSSLGQKTLQKIYAGIELRRLQIQKMLTNIDIGDCNFFRVSMQDYDNSPEAVADATRATWNVPPGAIDNVVRLIEEAGGIVVPFEFGTDKIDAISMWVADMPPLFFVNETRPWDRVRFTLCHEIGHLIMHRTPREGANIEAEADAFASAFLMPKSDLARHLSGLTLQKAATLKKQWKVSMQAIIYRATTLEKITERQRQYLWTQIGKMGYRTREPIYLDVPREDAVLLSNIVEFYLQQMHFRRSELANMVHLLEPEFRRAYLNQTSLRIIQ